MKGLLQMRWNCARVELRNWTDKQQYFPIGRRSAVGGAMTKLSGQAIWTESRSSILCWETLESDGTYSSAPLIPSDAQLNTLAA